MTAIGVHHPGNTQLANTGTKTMKIAKANF